VLATLGLQPTHVGERFVEWDDFSLAPADAAAPVTRRLHVGFVAPSHEHVDAFWRAGVDAGYRDDGEPGLRPQYRDDYYGAFLLDPDGNSAEAVHHGALRRGGNVDHLWIRVADLDAARSFYETIAPHAGFRVGSTLPDRVLFAGSSGSFSVVDDGEPTRAVQVAFPASSRAPVDAFHAAATAAGHRDNGGPGERREYHAGYYGAFVLDPDGNNVEVVHHDRG
jgi:predicted lactoylglutathione lyase